MPIEYKIDLDELVIRTDCKVDVSFEEVLAHFDELRRDPDYCAGLDVLMDLSTMTSTPDSQQLRSVSSDMSRSSLDLQFGACAVVATRQVLIGMVRVFSVFAESSFPELRLFSNAEEAETWLRTRKLEPGD